MKLDHLRSEIDLIDNQLVILIKKRLDIAHRIASAKKIMGKPVYDKKRENNVLSLHQQQGEQSGIRKRFIKELWNLILQESKWIQRNI